MKEQIEKMNKDKIITLNFIINPLKKFLNILKILGVDKYVKKFAISKFIALMIYAQIKELESFRDISSTLNSSEKLNQILFENVRPQNF